jgi:hypothetical protein
MLLPVPLRFLVALGRSCVRLTDLFQTSLRLRGTCSSSSSKKQAGYCPSALRSLEPVAASRDPNEVRGPGAEAGATEATRTGEVMVSSDHLLRGGSGGEAEAKDKEVERVLVVELVAVELEDKMRSGMRLLER